MLGKVYIFYPGDWFLVQQALKMNLFRSYSNNHRLPQWFVFTHEKQGENSQRVFLKNANQSRSLNALDEIYFTIFVFLVIEFAYKIKPAELSSFLYKNTKIQTKIENTPNVPPRVWDERLRKTPLCVDPEGIDHLFMKNDHYEPKEWKNSFGEERLSLTLDGGEAGHHSRAGGCVEKIFYTLQKITKTKFACFYARVFLQFW